MFFSSLRRAEVKKWQEPTDFAGLKWGSVPKDLDGHNEIIAEGRCEDKVEENGLRVCPAHLWLDDVRLGLTFYYVNQKLIGISVGFASKDYDFIKRAFSSRYGSPHKQKQFAVKTRGGDQLMNEDLQWLGSKVTIRLLKYEEKSTAGAGQIYTPEFVVHLLRRDAEEGKKAAEAGKKF